MRFLAMDKAREKAWETRRQKYGSRGHAGSYSRPPSGLERSALAMIVRLHEEGTLSEGQCCRGLNLERVEFRKLCDSFPFPPVRSRVV